MSILTPPKSLPVPPEPLWGPGPEDASLPINEVHVWRARLMEEPGRWNSCPVSRDRAGRVTTAVFRQDVLGRYMGAEGALPGVMSGPVAILPGLRVAVAQCDHLALAAVSRNVRGMGLDIERVREDIPFEEMAGGFLDARSQWDLRVTWSQLEKAWKFFQFWTSNEACSQAQPLSQCTDGCHVHGFSPEADFIAALAVEGGPEASVVYWDW